MTISDGIGAIIAALIVGFLTIIDNNRRKKDELFFKALDFLDGGSQKRNLGIAAIELSLKSKRHKSLCISLLIGSAIFLINESKHKDAEHEKNNLSRIMTLLLKPEYLNLSVKDVLLRENFIRLKVLNQEAMAKAIAYPNETKGETDVEVIKVCDYKLNSYFKKYENILTIK